MKPKNHTFICHKIIKYFNLKSRKEWKYTIARRDNENDLYEDQVSVQIQMKKERISQPAMMQFKLAWSTDIKDCGKECKDPRNNWEEVLDQKVWIDTGDIITSSHISTQQLIYKIMSDR